MSTGSPAPPYALLYGSFFLGTIIATAVYGVTCMQTFFYYVHYQNDLKRTKIFVATMWALNTIHEALIVAGTYKYVMAGLLDPNSCWTGNPEMILHILPTALVSVSIQGYLMHRIYVFIGKKVIVLLIWIILAITQIVTPLLYISAALYTANGRVNVIELRMLGVNPSATIGTINLIVVAIVDILIAVCMTFLLIRKRSRAGFTSTVHILQRLSIVAVNTGIWPATLALLTLILMRLYPASLVSFLPNIPVCAVYCNTLLANLNARAYIGGSATTHIIDMDLFSTSGPQEYKRAEIHEVRSVHS